MANEPSDIEIVRGWQGVRALVVGDIMLDSYVEGASVRLSDETPIPVVQKVAEDRASGGAANAAAALLALGADVTLIGLVGVDATGSLLRQTMRDYGLDDRWLIEDPGITTLHKLRIRANNQYIVRLDDGDTRCISDASRRLLLSRFREAFASADVTIVSDYRYGVVSDELIRDIESLRKDRPTVLVVDSKEIRRFTTSRATVVTPNWLEALVALEPHVRHDRAAVPTIADAEDVARRLAAVIDATYVTVTMSGDGVLLADREGSVQHVPTRLVPHAESIGAGDSFAAGMALALTVGASGLQAARIGNTAASIAVAKRGTAVADTDELLARLTTEEVSAATSAQALAARLDLDRHAGRTIVFTNGVFDILHAGHVDLLRRAKALGDVLVVGVNSDCSVRRLKGVNRPINREADRVAVIRSVSAVDHVVVFEEDDAARLIRMLRPHIHVKGADHVAEFLPEAEAVREVGGRIEILPLVAGRSTTGIVDQIRAGYTSDP